MVKKTIRILISMPILSHKKIIKCAEKQNRTISNFLTTAGLREVEREDCAK